MLSLYFVYLNMGWKTRVFSCICSTLDGKHVAGEGNCTEACEELKEGNSRLSTAVLRHCACESDWWRRAVFGHERSTQQSMPQSPLRLYPLCSLSLCLVLKTKHKLTKRERPARCGGLAAARWGSLAIELESCTSGLAH